MARQKMETAIAMIADPHFHDIHYRGQHDGPTIRSFRDTISQSRILNESYFSLRAALDEVVDGLIGNGHRCFLLAAE